MSNEHPFATFIRILGKGKNGQRPLSHAEAFEAMSMICRYEAEPEQISAFLMLMRVKEETPEEVAAFTEALRASMPTPSYLPRVSINWPAYAGKKRQLPWFLLAALTLARQGYPVFMHGLSRDDERLYIPEALEALDREPAHSLAEAAAQISAAGFSYLNLQQLSSLAWDLIDVRDLLGLRSPLHTVVRMLNPFSAPLSVVGVFHPGYAAIHQQAAAILGQSGFLVCKGDGGEFERVPDRAVKLYGIERGESWEAEWPARAATGRFKREDRLNLSHFRAVWSGDAEDDYADQAVTGTLGLVIRALGLEREPEAAHALAARWWQQRKQGTVADTQAGRAPAASVHKQTELEQGITA